MSGSLLQTGAERRLATNCVARQLNQRRICSLGPIPLINAPLEDPLGECTRTSELCGRLHVESDRHLWSRVRDALCGCSQTACTPTCWFDTRGRSPSRQNRCIAPCKVGRTQGCTSALVILFCKSPIRWRVIGGNLDESICERLDCTCKLRVLRTGQRIGAGCDAGRKLLEEGE